MQCGVHTFPRPMQNAFYVGFCESGNLLNLLEVVFMEVKQSQYQTVIWTEPVERPVYEIALFFFTKCIYRLIQVTDFRVMDFLNIPAIRPRSLQFYTTRSKIWPALQIDAGICRHSRMHLGSLLRPQRCFSQHLWRGNKPDSGTCQRSTGRLGNPPEELS